MEKKQDNSQRNLPLNCKVYAIYVHDSDLETNIVDTSTRCWPGPLWFIVERAAFTIAHIEHAVYKTSLVSHPDDFVYFAMILVRRIFSANSSARKEKKRKISIYPLDSLCKNVNGGGDHERGKLHTSQHVISLIILPLPPLPFSSCPFLHDIHICPVDVHSELSKLYSLRFS